jgi:hypothetical protein
MEKSLEEPLMVEVVVLTFFSFVCLFCILLLADGYSY